MNRYENRDYQEKGTAFLKAIRRGFLTDDPGLGKAQPYDALVLTDVGYRKIGELEVGDGVIGIDGNVYTVEGVFPQGTQEIYRITTNDGFTTEASDMHLWTLYEETRIVNGVRYRREYTKTTVEVLELMNTSKRRYSRLTQLPEVSPIKDFYYHKLNIAPYLMGVILGDGHISYHGVSISTADIEILDNCKKVLGDELEGEFTRLDLIGKRSHEKFVPFEFLCASYEDRLELLQGLMDTDGYISDNNLIQFCTTSNKLANDVMFLVWSLGGFVRKSEKQPKYNYKDEKRDGRKAYIVTIGMPDGVNPFKLERKASKVVNRTKYRGLRYIAKIESIGFKECVCIRVSTPDHLYITNNFIPTHNTPQAIKAVELPCMVVAPRYLCGQWEEAILREHGDAKIALTAGTRTQRQEILNKNADWYIVNPEMLKSYHFPTDITTFINDESHHLRNRNADAAKAAKIIENLDKNARIYNLTATPFWKTVDDIWMQCHILYPDVFTSYHKFVKTYCVTLRTPYGVPKVVSIKRAMREGLRELLKPIMYGRTYKEVGRFLPPVIESNIYINLSPALKSTYEKVKKEYKIKWLDGDEQKSIIFNPTTILHLFRQITFQADKISTIKGIIEDNNGLPAVIGFWYKDHARMMHENLPNSVLITGDMDALERHKLALHAQKTGKHIVASERSLSEGINLSSYRLFIFGEEHYVPGSNHQFLSRVVRDRNDDGRDRTPVRVFYVQAKETIDVHIHKVTSARNQHNNNVRKLLELSLD